MPRKTQPRFTLAEIADMKMLIEKIHLLTGDVKIHKEPLSDLDRALLEMVSEKKKKCKLSE